MADDICQNIQAAAMRHPKGDVFDAEIGRALNQLIEQGNDRFTAFQRKSLLAEVLRAQKAFELLG